MAIEFVDVLDSANQKYDNTTSGLTANNAKDAIDELAGDIAGFSGDMAISTQVDQLTVAAAVNTLYVVTTGATNGTCTVNLPTPTSAGARLGVIFHAENTDTDKVVISPAASDEIDGSTADIELTAPGEYLYLRAGGDGTNWYTYSSTSSGTAGTAAGVGSGSMQFIEKKTYSGASEATVDLTGYDSFLVRVVDFVPSTDDTHVWMQVSEDGGNTWKSGASDYRHAIGADVDDATESNGGSSGDSKIFLSYNVGNATGEHTSIDINVNSVSNGLHKTFKVVGSRLSFNGAIINENSAGVYNGTTNDIDALRIYPSSGTFSGSIVVYGIAEDHERFGVSSQFSGAMVKLTADDTAVDATSGHFISWDVAEYDSGTWWSAGNPTRLTVPAGVAKVSLTASVFLSLVTVDEPVGLLIFRNGAVEDLAGGINIAWNAADPCLTFSTAPLAVSEGDYFEVRLKTASDSSITISTSRTVFAIEAVGLVGTTIDKCRAYLANAYASAITTWEKVDLDTTSYDTVGIWDSTNERVIPSKAGYYLVSGQLSVGSSTHVAASVYKNGVQAFRIGNIFTNALSISGVDVVYCNGTTDYLELWGYTGASVNYTETSYLTVVGPILGTAQGSTDYLMSGFYPGAPTASAKMMVHAFAAGVTVDVAMAGSQGTAETAATAQTDFDVQKNGVSAGTMRFAAAATTATFIMATATSFSPGDKLQLIAPATPDATLADIAWSFKGNKA